MTAAALVTGNTVVIKPAEQSSVIGALIMQALEEAGMPPGVANLVSGTGEAVGSYLVVHPEVDFIAFTGSQRSVPLSGRSPVSLIPDNET